MKTLNLQPFIALLILLQLLSSCRSSRTASTTQTSATATAALAADSLHAHARHVSRSTTSVTVLPVATDLPLPDLTASLINHGGGTVIITRETETVSDTASTFLHKEIADTITAGHTEQLQPASARSRASPLIRSLTWLILFLCLLLVLLRRAGRQ